MRSRSPVPLLGIATHILSGYFIAGAHASPVWLQPDALGWYVGCSVIWVSVTGSLSTDAAVLPSEYRLSVINASPKDLV